MVTKVFGFQNSGDWVCGVEQFMISLAYTEFYTGLPTTSKSTFE